MQRRTRREFIQLGTAGAVALSAPARALLAASSTAQPRAWVTSKDRKFQPTSVPNWRSVESNSAKPFAWSQGRNSRAFWDWRGVDGGILLSIS